MPTASALLLCARTGYCGWWHLSSTLHSNMALVRCIFAVLVPASPHASSEGLWSAGFRASFRHPERGAPRRGARIHSDSWGTETPEYDSLALGVDTFAWVRPAVLPSQPLPARPHADLLPSMHSISPAPFPRVCGCLRQMSKISCLCALTGHQSSCLFRI